MRAQVEAAQERGAAIAGMAWVLPGKLITSEGGWFSRRLSAMRDYPLGPELEAGLDCQFFWKMMPAYGIGESWVGAGRGLLNWVD